MDAKESPGLFINSLIFVVLNIVYSLRDFNRNNGIWFTNYRSQTVSTLQFSSIQLSFAEQSIPI